MNAFDASNNHEAHLLSLKYQGYTVVADAIPQPILAALRARFDSLVQDAANVATAVVDENTGIVNLNRIYELDEQFAVLMDLPTVFPILRDAMAGDTTLLGGAIGQFMPVGTESKMHWHRDGDFMRLTYLLDDLPANGGGTAFVPSTHHGNDPLPNWCNGEDGPTEIPGMVTLAGRAGTCIINDPTLAHPHEQSFGSPSAHRLAGIQAGRTTANVEGEFAAVRGLHCASDRSSAAKTGRSNGNESLLTSPAVNREVSDVSAGPTFGDGLFHFK